MTNPNTENQTEALPVDPSAETASPEAPQDNNPSPQDSRRRLREMLAIPERDRSDAEWDEIIELEIQLAPGNRIGASDPLPSPPRRQGGRSGRQGGGGSGQNRPTNVGGGQPADAGAGQQKKHRPRTKSNRRPRQNKPGDGGGAGGGSGGTPSAA